MNQKDILMLYRYNQWANSKILNAASGVTLEQYLAPAAFPHGGLRSTLVHALSAEWIWRKRWEGTSPTSLLNPDHFPTLESLCERWREEEKQLMDFVSRLDQEALNRVFHYTNTAGKPFSRILWQVMAHVVNHGTQHRSEAAAMLTEYSCSPGDIDLITFLAESD